MSVEEQAMLIYRLARQSSELAWSALRELGPEHPSLGRRISDAIIIQREIMDLALEINRGNNHGKNTIHREDGRRSDA